MRTQDSPPLYLFKISIFCPKAIDFLTFFLLGASLALRSCFGGMMHKRSLHTMHTITARNKWRTIEREQTHNAHKRTCLHGRNSSGRRKAGKDPRIVLVTHSPPHLRHSFPEYVLLAWLFLLGLLCFVRFLVLGLYVDFCLHAPENVYI